jgi:hypothetical protein
MINEQVFRFQISVWDIDGKKSYLKRNQLSNLGCSKYGGSIHVHSPIKNTRRMKILQAHDNLGNVVTSPLLGEVTKGLDKSSAVASIEVFHDSVEMIFGSGEGVEELDNEVQVGQAHANLTLGFDVHDLVLGDHVLLLQDLDCIVVSHCFLPCQPHLPKCPLADWLQHIKVLV